ncbi:beta-1,3-galactosyltransferase 1 [Chanos chanos]|uniref:Hexosyltransferase n=1 Tax=Chanos chanos TaxID=29144 RepID=A0A6J2WTW8_CHACN|nr:beta-1,3-galactosyltransferase 1-like [Chanos chanos]
MAMRRMFNKLVSILKSTSHPHHDGLVKLKSTFRGRLISPKCSTERYRRSRVISLLGPPKRPTPISSEFFKLISPSTYKYILNQPEACRRRNPFLALMIPTAPDGIDYRNSVRKTWGQSNLIPNITVVRLFYVGIPANNADRRIQEGLEKESEHYGDIIQMDFLDSYYNLTIKTMMIMNWLATHCRSASFAMKIDADVFLNVPYLVNYLVAQGRSTLRDFITGSVIKDGRPRRSQNSKWYLPEHVYPEAFFPPYVSGAGYVFSIDLAKKISWASKFARPVPLEDVYVGLCLRVLGIKPAYAQTLFPLRNLFEVRRLKYERCTFANYILITGFTPRQLINIWHDFQNARLSC